LRGPPPGAGGGNGRSVAIATTPPRPASISCVSWLIHWGVRV